MSLDVKPKRYGVGEMRVSESKIARKMPHFAMVCRGCKVDCGCRHARAMVEVGGFGTVLLGDAIADCQRPYNGCVKVVRLSYLVSLV